MADQIQFWAIDQITPYERNARSHSDSQIAQIASSIDEFGFTNPILVNADRQIIAGHARFLAARKRGLNEVPVIVLEHLTPVQQRAYRIADNQIALSASWNEDVLRQELQALIEEAFEMDLLGVEPQSRNKSCTMRSPGASSASCSRSMHSTRGVGTRACHH